MRSKWRERIVQQKLVLYRYRSGHQDNIQATIIKKKRTGIKVKLKDKCAGYQTGAKLICS